VIEKSNSATRLLSNFILAAIGQLLNFEYKSFDSLEAGMAYLAHFDHRVASWLEQH